MRKYKDPERRSEIEERIAWVVSTHLFEVCLPRQMVWFLLVYLITFTCLFRINSWNLIQQRILRHRFWLSTRRKREKQQSRENVHFISRNVILLFLPHHFISLFYHFRYVRSTISAYVNFISFIWTLKRSSLLNPKYETFVMRSQYCKIRITLININ